mgnify:CR=1 FL=1
MLEHHGLLTNLTLFIDGTFLFASPAYDKHCRGSTGVDIILLLKISKLHFTFVDEFQENFATASRNLFHVTTLPENVSWL